MWNIHSTTQLLKDISKSTEPDELVRLFFEHVRQKVSVQRALVLSNAGLSSPEYRLVHYVDGKPESSTSVVAVDELRTGGLLAEILYAGEFGITEISPTPSDPAFDLLRESRSLIAFPLFESGKSAGMVVMLGAAPLACSTTDLCAFATIASLLGRAIETQKLANQLEGTCRALDAELEAAAKVQRWLLPSLPTLENASVAASYRTARYAGGDYYDVGLLPDGKLGVLIADVSGKGAAAAVLMAVLRSIVHDEVDRARIRGPAALLDYADRRLCAMGLPERGAFITAFCGIFDPATGAIVYSCAGHNPPRLLRVRERTITALEGARSFPLGILADPPSHTEEAVRLMPGDLALFYTDGITEARSPAGEFFDVQRLDEILRHLPDPVTPGAAVQAIQQGVSAFTGDKPPADDQTLLALGASASAFIPPYSVRHR